MSLLASKNYDPPTTQVKSCSSAIPMTAFDTTNLRLTVTAPTSGKVLVRLRVPVYVGTSQPNPGITLGIMSGSTVVARVAPSGTGGWPTNSAQNHVIALESVFTVTGLTAGNSYTWDAAYSVGIVAVPALRYGGPNDTSGVHFGAFLFEVWEA